MIPLPFEVEHYTRSDSGSTDAHGNLTITWSPPLSGAGTLRKVAGWSFPGSDEPAVPGTDRRTLIGELLVDKNCPIRALDRVKLNQYPQGMYEVMGDPKDYTHSPFNGPLGRGFGFTLTLRKIDG